jgi:hypothetical protein
MSVINVSLEDTFEQWRVKTNAISSFAGDQASLQTSSTNLVAAINEVRSYAPIDGTITTYGNLFQVNIDTGDSAELILDQNGNLTLAGKLIADVQGNVLGNSATASKLLTGRIISITGDATWNVTFDGSSNQSAALALNPTGVVPGTYTKFTVNGAGQITSATSTWNSADVTSALGYIPVSTSAGYSDPSWITGLSGAKILSNTSITVTNATVGNRLLVGNGSATQPSIAFSADTDQNTGLYWSTEGYILFTNQGVLSGAIQPGGHLVMAGDVVAYSDVKFKENIETIKDALGIVNQMRGVYYDHKASKERKIGVIAQEVNPHAPELIHTEADGTLGVAYGNMGALLLQAINELTERVKALEDR